MDARPPARGGGHNGRGNLVSFARAAQAVRTSCVFIQITTNPATDFCRCRVKEQTEPLSGFGSYGRNQHDIDETRPTRERSPCRYVELRRAAGPAARVGAGRGGRAHGAAAAARRGGARAARRLCVGSRPLALGTWPLRVGGGSLAAGAGRRITGCRGTGRNAGRTGAGSKGIGPERDAARRRSASSNLTGCHENTRDSFAGGDARRLCGLPGTAGLLPASCRRILIAARGALHTVTRPGAWARREKRRPCIDPLEMKPT